MSRLYMSPRRLSAPERCAAPTHRFFLGGWDGTALCRTWRADEEGSLISDVRCCSLAYQPG